MLISAEMAKARCKTQVDIGFGDAVTPGPVHSVYPVLIADLPAPRLQTYPDYTVVSEKLLAIALLGMTDIRVKDYLNLWVLLDREMLNSHTLATAIAATFTRRSMAVPAKLPIGLIDEFANDPSRKALWSAFLKKNDLAVIPLIDVVAKLRTILETAIMQAVDVTADADKPNV